MAEQRRKSARPVLALIALVFFGPLAVAAWMYYGGHFETTTSNNGELLEPFASLAEEVPGSEVLERGRGSWLLLYTNNGECADTCRDALYTMRQGRQMLGKEQNRLLRVFLHGATSPDTVFITDEHQGLITTQEAGLSDFLNNKKPTELPDGGYYLVDPLGNLVMYFRPDLNPSEMVDDIKRLLRLSRIG